MPRKIIWKELTALDWFGLISGIVGFVVDIVALSKISTFQSSSQGSSQSISIIGWIFLFVVMAYTIFICGFYARRVLAARNYGASRTLSFGQYERVEKGAQVFVYLVGITLSVFFFTILFLGSTGNAPAAANNMPAATVTPVPTISPVPSATGTARPISKEESEAFGNFLLLTLAIGVGIGVGAILCLVLGEAARALYTAFDPEYEP